MKIDTRDLVLADALHEAILAIRKNRIYERIIFAQSLVIFILIGGVLWIGLH